MVTLEFKGLKEIIDKMEGLGQDVEVAKVEKKIIQDVGNKAKETIRTHFQTSKDNSKSGKRGYRPSGHFRDNIPISNVKKGRSGYYLVIGDKKGTGEYFYSKFPSWGTSKQSPNHSFEIARDDAQKLIDSIGIKEFEQMLQQALDGK